MSFWSYCYQILPKCIFIEEDIQNTPVLIQEYVSEVICCMVLANVIKAPTRWVIHNVSVKVPGAVVSVASPGSSQLHTESGAHCQTPPVEPFHTLCTPSQGHTATGKPLLLYHCHGLVHKMCNSRAYGTELRIIAKNTCNSYAYQWLKCMAVVSPLLMQWRYHSLALSYW